MVVTHVVSTHRKTENRCSTKRLCTNVHSNTVYNRPWQRLPKLNLTDNRQLWPGHPDRRLFSHLKTKTKNKKTININTWHCVNEPQKLKPDSKCSMLYESVYTKYPKNR